MVDWKVTLHLLIVTGDENQNKLQSYLTMPIHNHYKLYLIQKALKVASESRMWSYLLSSEIDAPTTSLRRRHKYENSEFDTAVCPSTHKIIQVNKGYLKLVHNKACGCSRPSVLSVADFHLFWRSGSLRLGVKGQQKLKNICDLHTLKLAKTVKICL